MDKPKFTVPYERLPECMPLRDYFAAQVLNGYFANNHKDEVEEIGLLFDTSTYRRIADHCYEMADQMLEAKKHNVPYQSL